MDLLKKLNGDIFRKVSDLEVDENKYIIENTKEKLDTIKVKVKDKFLYLQSRYYPATEAHEWLDSNINKQNEIHVFFGFGLGYYLLDLIKNIPVNDKIFVYEPDINVFKLAIKTIDLENIFFNKEVSICIGEIQNFYASLNYGIEYTHILKTSVYLLPNYELVYPKEKKEFEITFNDIFVKNALNVNTVAVRSDVWQENLLKNAEYIFESSVIKEFEGKFKGIPVILVSAGPSLNKNVSLLRKAQGKAIIICIGRALRVLLNEGIKPDIVAALDATELSATLFEDLEYSDSVLLYALRAHPDIAKNHNGRKIIFPNSEQYLSDVMSKFGINYDEILCGGSVSTMIFSFAKFAGADPIVFVGQDLAYSGKETHAKGTYYGENKDLTFEDRKLMTVTGINGEKLSTGVDFYAFLKWFESEIYNDNTGREFINATEGGANIEGTVVKSLSKVIEEYCKRPVDSVIDDVFKSSIKYDPQIIRSHVTELEQMLKSMDSIVNLSKKAISYSDELLNIYKLNTGKNVSKVVEHLDNIDKEFLNKKEEFVLLNNIMIPVYDKVLSQKRLPDNISEKERGIQIAKTSREFYEDIKNVILKSKPLVSELVTKMKDKYAEENGDS
jgi:Uncharacterized protein conserved in bacteria